MSAIYYQGSDLPDLAITWNDPSGTLINFGAGWTFAVKVGTSTTTSFTKTTGITGASTAPNVTVAWAAADELNDLDPGVYTIEVKATRTSDSKERIMQAQLRVKPALA